MLADINITPLVAFILTIPVLTNAVHVNLPKTVTTTPPEQQKAVTVTVNSEAEVYLDSRLIDPGSLQSELLALKAANPDLSLHLRADDHVLCCQGM